MKTFAFNASAAIITIIAANAPAAAQTGGGMVEPGPVIDAVKEAYLAIFDTPQRVTQRYRTTTRTEGTPDIASTGTIVVLQQGEKLRGEIDVASIIAIAEDGPGETLSLPGRTVFVQDEDTLSVHHAGEGSETISYSIEESELEGDLATMMMGEGATLAFFDAMSQVAVIAREEFYQGREVITLRSTEPFPVGPLATADAKFWVDTETMLVEHMEVDFRTEVLLPREFTAWTSMEADFQYELGVEIDPAAFSIELHENFENFSDEVNELAGRQMERMQ